MAANAEAKPFTVKLVERIDREALQTSSRNGTGYFLLTPAELALMNEYLPSMSYRFSRDLGLQPPGHTAEFKERLALQVQSEIVTKGSTIDACLIHGRRDAGSVGSKLYHIKRFTNLFRMLGLEAPQKIPAEVVERGDLDEILIAAKLRFVELLRNMPEWSVQVSYETKKADMDKEQRVRFAYLEDILGLAGDSVVAVVLYGSASRESDPANFADYDNYLVVRDGTTDSIARRIVGKRLANPSDGKPVSLNVIEESSFSKFARFNHNGNENLENCVLLYGQADLPIVPDLEVQERGVVHALVRAKSLKAASVWVAQDTAVLMGKEHLFAFFQKSPLFITQAGLNYARGVASRAKSELLDAMGKVSGGAIFPYEPTPGYLMNATHLAAMSATTLVEHFFSNKKFQNGFMQLV